MVVMQGGLCSRAGCDRPLTDTLTSQFARIHKFGQPHCVAVSAAFARDAHVAMSDVWLPSARLPPDVSTSPIVACPSEALQRAGSSPAALACLASVAKLEHYYGCKLSRDRPTL